jgi:hypothetical protein
MEDAMSNRIPAVSQGTSLDLVVNERQLAITYRGDPDLLSDLDNAWCKRPSKLTRAFERFLKSQARPLPTRRYRTATLNLQIPRDVYDRFSDACEKAGKMQPSAIRMILTRYIDGKREERRPLRGDDRKVLKDHYGQRRMIVPAAEALNNPEFEAEPDERVRYQFDARSDEIKTLIEEVIADVGVTKSKFFSFVLSEAVVELNGPSHRPNLPEALPLDRPAL